MTFTSRRQLDGLWRHSEHPILALEHMAPFSSDPKLAKGQKQQHQSNVIEQCDWTALIDVYRKAFDSRHSALEEYKGAFEGGITKHGTMTVTGRLATGLGLASVMENGLLVNHAYGLPMLSGSGLKGMASAMAHLGLDGDSWKMGTTEQKYKDQGKDHRALFGARSTGSLDAAAGMVIFHDAWWVPSKGGRTLPFELDVVTPHQAKYVLEGKEWPNDWTDPVPSPFMTVTGSFEIALTGPPEWVEAAFEILKMAFQHLGFGAKTQIGYGRGELVEKVQKETPKEETQEGKLFRIARNAGFHPDQVGAYEVRMENKPTMLVTNNQVKAFLPELSTGQKNKLNDKGLKVLCTYFPGENTPRGLSLPPD